MIIRPCMSPFSMALNYVAATLPQVPTEPGLPQASTTVFFGDSITEALAFTTAERWVNIVGTSLGSVAFNRGLSGTVLQNSNVAAGTPSPNNGLDRYNTTNYGVVGANRRARIFIALGFNDARYIDSELTFNVTQYIADYHELIAKLIDAGYTPDTICIVGPYWISDVGLNSGSDGFRGQTRVKFEAFVAAAKSVAVAHNTWYCDPYAYMRDNGAESLIGPDFYHPNAAGQAAIAVCVLAAKRANSLAQPVLSANSPTPGAVNYSFTATAGATSYTVEYMLAGGSTFTGTVTSAPSGGSFTGLTQGIVSVRVRANYVGGSSGWVYKRVLATTLATFAASFTATAGTSILDYIPETGGQFQAQNGFAPATPSLIQGTDLYSTSTGGVYRVNQTALWTNMRIRMVLKYYSVVTGDQCGVTFRAQAAANTFYFVSYFRTDNTLRLYRNAGANNVEVKRYAMTFTSGVKNILIDVRDLDDGPTQIDVYEEGNATAIMTYQDVTPITGGSWGVRDPVVKAAGTGIHVDDVSVTYLAP